MALATRLMVVGDGDKATSSLISHLSNAGWEVTLFSSSGASAAHGQVLTGPLGSAANLVRILVDRRIEVVVDAGDPWDYLLHEDLDEACRAARLPLVVFRPTPPQKGVPGSWIQVNSPQEAADFVRRNGRHILVEGLTPAFPSEVFAEDRDNLYVFRPAPVRNVALPTRHRFSDPAPHKSDSSFHKAFFRDNQVDTIVMPESHAYSCDSLLDAARKHAIPVVMIGAPSVFSPRVFHATTVSELLRLVG